MTKEHSVRWALTRNQRGCETGEHVICRACHAKMLLSTGRLGEKIECPYCNGSGKFASYPHKYDCPRCRGLGYEWKVIE